MPFGESEMTAYLAPALQQNASSATHYVPDDANAVRRANIQRAVDVSAAIVLGALGALAGTVVVILLLVALIIPATMIYVLGMIAGSALLFLVTGWLMQRADAGAKAEADLDARLAGAAA